MRPRINTGQSGGSGERKSRVESRGKAPIGGLGNEPAEAEAFWTITFGRIVIVNACLDRSRIIP